MTGVVYESVDDWITIAALVLDTTDATIRRVANLDLADSALNAPAAGFGDTEFYPDLITKAAVLGWHLTMNHALPDGNKRTAFITTVDFLERNGAVWSDPDVDDAVAVMLATCVRFAVAFHAGVLHAGSAPAERRRARDRRCPNDRHHDDDDAVQVMVALADDATVGEFAIWVKAHCRRRPDRRFPESEPAIVYEPDGLATNDGLDDTANDVTHEVSTALDPVT